MTNGFLFLITLVIFMHGIGHVLFLVPSLGLAQWGQATRSWLLTDRLGYNVTRAIGASIWSVVVVVYLLGVIGLLTGAAWWPPVLMTASVLSAVGLALFWATPLSSSAFFALMVDLALVIAIQVFQWLPR